MLDADTGLPIAGVFVYLYDSSGSGAGFGKTNARGEYYGDAGLAAGNYYAVTSNTAGYVDQVFGAGACAGCDPRSGTPIVVTAEATRSGIDFALLRGPRIPGP